jgi:exosome complex component RRP41
MSLTSKNEETPLINEKGLRMDGRRLDELRPIHLEVGYLSRADGSAYIEHGKNKIVAAVYGPRELHPRHLAQSDRALLRVTYRMATFSVSERKRPAPSRREHEISMVIRQALEPMLFLKMYPRSVVDVFIQVLEADGGSRCASTTVASLALADAGIPMRSLVAGVAVGKVAETLVSDLSDVEDKVGDADVPVAMASDRGEITLLQMDGKLTPKEFATVLSMAEDGIAKIHQMQKTVLQEKYAQIRDELDEIEEEAKDVEPVSDKPPEDKTVSKSTPDQEKPTADREDPSVTEKAKEPEKIEKPPSKRSKRKTTSKDKGASKAAKRTRKKTTESDTEMKGA